MKTKKNLSSKALVVSILALASAALPLSALTPPLLKIADQSGNSVTIDSTGVVSCTGSCSTGTVDVSTPGVIGWTGTVGHFTLTTLKGQTKPFITPPALDLEISSVINNGAAAETVTVSLTDTGFTATGPEKLQVLGKYTSATYSAYFGTDNQPFSTVLPVGSIVNPPLDTNVANFNVLSSPTSPISMTAVASITIGAGGFFTDDFSFTASKPKLSLSCAGSTGQVDVPYHSALIASGGTSPYSFLIASGSLPPGLTLNASTGAISGTPTAYGPFNFTAQVTDSSGNQATNTATSNCGITIAPPGLTLSCASATTGQVGVPYSSALQAIGGVAPYTFSIFSGMLPPGLTLDSKTGTIAGTPTTAGAYPFIAKVVDSQGTQAIAYSPSCGITIGKPPSASCVAITAVQGFAITPVTLTGTGGAGAPYTFTATGLPAGLSISSSGTISGTPTVSGTFNYTVTITDKSGNKGTVNCSVVVNPPACVPTTYDLTGNTPTTGTNGNIRTFVAPNGAQVKVSAFSRQKGNGTWETAYLGSYPLGLGVTDRGENGVDPTHKVDNVGDRVDYVLFEFSSPVVVNRAFLDAVGSDSDITVWIGNKTDPFNNHLTLSDSLLTSLGFTEDNLTSSADSRWADINNGNLLGNVLVIAALPSDTSPEDEFKISSIETSCTPAGGNPSASCVAINATKGLAITPVTLTGTGGAGGPYTFSAIGLPAGLTLSSSGTIAGTPTVSGTYNYTVKVTDKNGNSGTFNCSVTVNPPVICAPSTFDLTGNTATTGTPGNIRTFTSSNGVLVKASAFSRRKADGLWETGYLGSYSPGLGVTDRGENGDDPSHKVDNVGDRVDYVLFEFSSPVVVNRVFLDAVGADSDMTVWIGTKTDPFNNHLTLSDSVLAGLGYTEDNVTNSADARWADINAGNRSGNVIVIAALPSDTSPEDEFKISKIETFCGTAGNLPSATCAVIKAVKGTAITPVTLTGTGGAGGPYTFSATGLPSGLSISSAGKISGTPNSTGTFNYTVTVKDKNGASGTVNCSVTVSSYNSW